jgi:Zn-dependent protease with chaperone function
VVEGLLKLRIAVVMGLLWGYVFAALPAWALTLPEEVRLGKQVAVEVRPLGLTRDPSLDAIGARLAPVMQRKELTWRFWVVEGMKDFNAFAAPGGFVFITRPYYEKLDGDEAAFVIGHEMAHIDLRHYEKQAKREERANVGNLLLKVLATRTGALSTAADIGATAYVTHYSRVLEREADFAGYKYAEAAGYDSAAAVGALSKLGKEPKMHPWISNIYATHPILSVREDRLAALGGKEPEGVKPALPAKSHRRDLTSGLQPFDPPVPIAMRIVGSDGKRWEGRWRKSFTKVIHARLTPLGFRIAGNDLMYKPDIGDPVAAARSREAKYLLLVTVNEMQSSATGAEQLTGTPVKAKVGVAARLVEVASGKGVGSEIPFAKETCGTDVMPADPGTLYGDTTVGQLAESAAGALAVACAKAAGAKPAPPEPKPETAKAQNRAGH